MLDKVNPGLKSRVADVIDFPDFTAEAAAELAAMQLEAKSLALPEGAPSWAVLEPWTRPLVDAPGWANGRDVETFVRHTALPRRPPSASEGFRFTIATRGHALCRPAFL